MNILEIIRIIFGSIFVLFIPGFSWSHVFFKKDEIDLIERIALSFGLSIALVPLVVFYLNFLLKVNINLVNVSIVVLVLAALPLVYLRYLKGKVKIDFLQHKSSKS